MADAPDRGKLNRLPGKSLCAVGASSGRRGRFRTVGTNLGTNQRAVNTGVGPQMRRINSKLTAADRSNVGLITQGRGFKSRPRNQIVAFRQLLLERALTGRSGFMLGLLGTKHAIQSHVSRCGSSVFHFLMRVAVRVAGSERAVADPLLLQILGRSRRCEVASRVNA
jgi:hypothetical protein